MDDHIQQTISTLQAELKEQEAAALQTKKLINALCVRAKIQPIYGDAELQASQGPSLTIRSDQFYGQPLITAVRQILEMRKARDQGPATINEIYDALIEGGFAFETKNPDNAKRGLRISISKKSDVFHKIPNSGRIGLLEWYPNAKTKKKDVADADDESGDEGEPDQEGK